ncbi:MAG: BsuPI-related putative proteinase inhibitor [Halanaerobiales bacterium]
MKEELFTYFVILILTAGFLIGSTLMVAAGESNDETSENMETEAAAEDNEEISSINLEVQEVEDTRVVLLKELVEQYELSLFFNSSRKRVWIYDDNNNIMSFFIGKEGDTNDTDVFNDNENNYFSVIKNDRTYIELKMINQILEELEQKTVELVTDMELQDNNRISREKEKIVNLSIYNITGEPVTLSYGSGKLFDLWILKPDTEEELWRWSDGRFFTMAIHSKEIEPADKIEQELEILIEEDDDINPGEYLLTGEIATREPSPMELEVIEIEIEE